MHWLPSIVVGVFPLFWGAFIRHWPPTKPSGMPTASSIVHSISGLMPATIISCFSFFSVICDCGEDAVGKRRMHFPAGCSGSRTGDRSRTGYISRIRMIGIRCRSRADRPVDTCNGNRVMRCWRNNRGSCYGVAEIPRWHGYRYEARYRRILIVWECTDIPSTRSVQIYIPVPAAFSNDHSQE